MFIDIFKLVTHSKDILMNGGKAGGPSGLRRSPQCSVA